jgi:DNA-3-methyladenine glycosylase I
MKDVPARTDVSDAISKDLRRRGFRFVGSTIVYALMQAVGLVNDHLVTCYRHAQLAGAKLPRR